MSSPGSLPTASYDCECPAEIWSLDEMDQLRSRLLAEKTNYSKLVSCIFWSLSKFRIEWFHNLFMEAIEDAEKEHGHMCLQFDLRKVIMEDGMLVPANGEGIKKRCLVAQIRTPTREWIRGAEIQELSDFLKEMVVAVILEAESNVEEDTRMRTTGIGFTPTCTQGELPEIVAAVDQALETCKKQSEAFNLQSYVTTISRFTTVDEHRQYFRSIMNEIDQIDGKIRMYHKAVYSYKDLAEEIARERQKNQERKAEEEAQEAVRREKFIREMMSTRPAEIWNCDDLDTLGSTLCTKKANKSKLVSCVFWSLTKFQLEKFHQLFMAAIADAERELGCCLTDSAYDVRKIIMEDGFGGHENDEEVKKRCTVAQALTPVKECTSAAEVRNLSDFLKEMIIAVVKNSVSYYKETNRVMAGLELDQEESLALIASVDREIEVCKTGTEEFDLQECVTMISRFTTIEEHRQYFRTVMDEIDQIDERIWLYNKAICLYNHRSEEIERKAEEEEEAARKKRTTEYWRLIRDRVRSSYQDPHRLIVSTVTSEASKRPAEIWNSDDLFNFQRTLWSKLANTAKMISCVFWSLEKFQREKFHQLFVAAIADAEQELGCCLTSSAFDVREIIMEDGLPLPMNCFGIKKQCVENRLDKQVIQWTSETELRDLSDFLKEMAIAVVRNGESYNEEETRATHGFIPTEEEVSEIIASVDVDIKSGLTNCDLEVCVRQISRFTTVGQHRKYFRWVMGVIDRIDQKILMLNKATCLYTDCVEEIERQQEERKEAERRQTLEAGEDAEEAEMRE